MLNVPLNCNGCEVCVNICPNNCITMEHSIYGFRYPKISVQNCIECGLCNNRCPVINPEIVQLNKNIDFFAAYTLNEKDRKYSSSGGVFSALAKRVIESGGVVFGVAFDEQMHVVHTYVKQREDIIKLQGSKYVQSKIENTYKDVKRFLDEGRLVYFSGTPCEIGGVKTYLNKEYDNLICQDIICHGVPSPGVWEKYLDELRAKYGMIRSISFRNKRKGWSHSHFLVEFENGNELFEEATFNSYVGPFLCNLNLRESCFDCKYKNLHRCADITLADFWGVDYNVDIVNDDQGISFVMVHTEKGRKLLEDSNCFLKTVTQSQGINPGNNQSAIVSAIKPKRYEMYMKEIINCNTDKVYKKYFRPNFMEKVILKMRETLGKR